MNSELNQSQLHNLANNTRNIQDVPGLAVTVFNSDDILLSEIQGNRVFDQPAEISETDYFHIGSCAKSMLALIAAKLIERKLISWETKFFDLYPELAAVAQKAYRNITLEDLFLCQAGIKAYTDAATDPLPEFDARVSDPALEFMRQLVALPPAAKETANGFQRLYSNAGYTMASAMLERVAGKTWAQLISALGNDLGIAFHQGWPNAIDANQPWGHMITGDGIEVYPPDHDYRLPALIAPAGDLSLTVQDFTAYTQRHLRGLRGRDSYLSHDSYRHLHHGHEGFSLGIGNGSLNDKQYSWFEGSAGTFFCRAIIVADADFAFNVMVNASTDCGALESIDWLSQEIITRHFNWR